MSSSEQDKIVKILEAAHVKWFEIGKKLKMPITRLFAIQQHHQADAKASFVAMLIERFQGNPDVPRLIEVLMSPDINLPKIANNLQGKNIAGNCLCFHSVCVSLFSNYIYLL